VIVQNWVPLLAAVVAGGLGLLGAVLGSPAQRQVRRDLERLEQQRRELDRADRSRELLDRYQEPLVRAAYGLSWCEVTSAA
jgi:hypothetical protein